MRRSPLPSIAFVVAVASLLAVASPRAAAQSNPLAEIERHQQKLFERVAPSVVFINRTETFGSGFFISSNGTILTNAHVVGDANRVDVVLHDGRQMKGEVLKRAENIDLALVQVDPEGKVPVVELTGMDQVEVGSWVASIGHGSGGIWSFTTGSVSNIYPDGEERPVFQTQIPINPGASGGPVIDRRGRIVGIVTAKIESAENMNFAIPVQIGMKRFDALAQHCDCLVVRAPAKAPIYVDGSMVGTGPEVVIPAEEKTYEVFTVVGGEKRKTECEWPSTRTVDFTETGDGSR